MRLVWTPELATGYRQIDDQMIGSKESMTDPLETERITGFRPGGACPFGLEGVGILLDRDLGQYESVFPAAGNDATGVRTTLDQLARITCGRVVEFKGAE